MATIDYLGSELGLFAYAVHWKRYWTAQIRPFLRGQVLDVGAGLGATAKYFASTHREGWTCLEPDPQLSQRIRMALNDGQFPRPCTVITGTLDDLPVRSVFDTILYIDVLEHVAHHREELLSAALHLRSGGHMIVLSPAHQSLYSEFDRSIGHFRRYSKSSLVEVAPAELRQVRLRYLDSVGALLSFANRILLKQGRPSRSQILFWDRCMIPISRYLGDRLSAYSLGKTVLGIWQKP